MYPLLTYTSPCFTIFAALLHFPRNPLPFPHKIPVTALKGLRLQCLYGKTSVQNPLTLLFPSFFYFSLFHSSTVLPPPLIVSSGVRAGRHLIFTAQKLPNFSLSTSFSCNFHLYFPTTLDIALNLNFFTHLADHLLPGSIECVDSQ